MMEIRQTQGGSEKKRAFLDLVQVLISNIFHMASGIVVELLIPKLLGYQDYGFYKTYILYVGYLGLLHFGITDGIYFVFAGKTLDEITKKEIHSAISWLSAIELFLSIFGCAISLFFIDTSVYGLIFLLVSVYNLVYNVDNCYSSVCQALKFFRGSSIASIIKSIVNIVYVGTCYLIFAHSEATPSFVLFSFVNIAASLAADIFYTIQLRSVIFSKGISFQESLQNLKKYIFAGLPLLFANLTSNLLMMVDKQFISIFYPVEESNIFSIYSFAYSMLNLITVATSAISSVLFPYMRGKDNDRLIQLYPRLMSALDVFVCLACFSYFFVYWFLNHYLTKYVDSIPIFRMLLPGLAINVPVVVLMHSYYKTFDKEKSYFLQNLIVLVLGILADAGIYYLYIKPYSYNNPIGITITSLFVILIWFAISEGYLDTHYHVKHWKNDFYLCLCIASFFLSTHFLSVVWALLAYSLLFLSFTGVFYWKEIRYFFCSLRSRKTKKND
jgi:O-antigen/teichoic acid export membrane protein